MTSKKQIPVHRLNERFAGVYIAPLGTKKSLPEYEVSQPHRHDFYYCLLLDKGTIALEVDFKKLQIAGPSVFLSYPGQIHHVDSAKMERGWFLAFDPDKLDIQLIDILDQCLSEVISLSLPAEQSTALSAFSSLLYTVYQGSNQLFRQNIIRSMLTAFVYQVTSAYLTVEQSGLSRHSFRSIEITKGFRQMLRRNFKIIRRPSEYAARMNLTTTYLNDTVRAVTGFPVTYFIQQELTREAQRLLRYSDLGVAEIADDLGFDDARYFNRMFSKVVGMSPGAFRKTGETSIHLSPS